MAEWLRQSTSITKKIGPFLDETDGKTAEPALTLTQPDIRLSKNGGAFAQKAAAQTLTHDENGYYGLTLDATDIDTLGRLTVHVHKAGALPVWHEFMVVPANVWDSLFGSDKLQTDTVQWLGTAVATPTVAGVPEVDLTHIEGGTQTVADLKDFADSGYDPATNKVQGVVLVDTVTAVTNDVGVTQAGADKVWSTTTRTITGLTTAAIKSIWDQLTSALTTAGSIGKKLTDWVLGSDNKVEVSADVHSSGQTVAAVTGNVGGNVTGSVGSLATTAKAEVNAEVDTALTDIHLDHLLATDTPDPLPGAAGSILADLLEDDAGVWRFIANALEEGPGGGGSGETRLREGTAQGGAAGTVTLDAGASGTNDLYKHCVCALTGGTGAGQAQIIDSYNGTTKVATMSANWATAPDATTTFVLLPLGTIPGASAPTAAAVADAVLDELLSGHETAGSAGEALQFAKAHAGNKQVANSADGTVQLYKDDGATVLVTHTMTPGADDDEVESVPS